MLTDDDSNFGTVDIAQLVVIIVTSFCKTDVCPLYFEMPRPYYLALSYILLFFRNVNMQ